MDFGSLVKQLMMMGGGGNIPLYNRPQTQMGDGSVATVRSMSIGTPDGEVLIPTIREDGWPMSDKQAIDWYRKTGRHLGKFRTPEEADRYAELLHRQQEQFYRK